MDDKGLLDAQRFNETERAEILQEIETLTRREGLATAVSVRPRKAGWLFPLAVNVLCAGLVAGAWFGGQWYFAQRSESVIERSSQQFSTEGRLLAKLAEENRRQIDQKNAEIQRIQNEAARLEAEKTGLESTFNQQLEAREAELRASLGAALAAERRRLAEEGLDAEELNRRLSAFESQQRQDFDRALSAARAESQAQLEARNRQLAELQQRLESSRREEEALRASLTAAQAAQAQPDPALAAQAQDLARLREQNTEAQNLVDQWSGTVDRVRTRVASLDPAGALQALEPLSASLTGARSNPVIARNAAVVGALSEGLRAALVQWQERLNSGADPQFRAFKQTVAASLDLEPGVREQRLRAAAAEIPELRALVETLEVQNRRRGTEEQQAALARAEATYASALAEARAAAAEAARAAAAADARTAAAETRAAAAVSAGPSPELTARMAELQTQLDSLRSGSQGLQTQLEETVQRVSQLTRERDEARTQLNTVTQETVGLRQELEELRSLGGVLDAETRSAAALRQELETARSDLASTRTELEAALRDLALAQTRETEAAAQITELTSARDEAAARVLSLEQALGANADGQGALAAQLETLRTELAGLEFDLEERNGLLTQRSEELTILRARLTEAEAALRAPTDWEGRLAAAREQATREGRARAFSELSRAIAYLQGGTAQAGSEQRDLEARIRDEPAFQELMNRVQALAASGSRQTPLSTESHTLLGSVVSLSGTMLRGERLGGSPPGAGASIQIRRGNEVLAEARITQSTGSQFEAELIGTPVRAPGFGDAVWLRRN